MEPGATYGSARLAALIAGQLSSVTASDLGSFALAAAVLATVALITSLLPALRALGVDPVTALRSE